MIINHIYKHLILFVALVCGYLSTLGAFAILIVHVIMVALSVHASSIIRHDLGISFGLSVLSMNLTDNIETPRRSPPQFIAKN
jgi:hypothetical protein